MWATTRPDPSERSSAVRLVVSSAASMACSALGPAMPPIRWGNRTRIAIASDMPIITLTTGTRPARGQSCGNMGLASRARDSNGPSAIAQKPGRTWPGFCLRSADAEARRRALALRAYSHAAAGADARAGAAAFSVVGPCGSRAVIAVGRSGAVIAVARCCTIVIARRCVVVAITGTAIDVLGERGRGRRQHERGCDNEWLHGFISAVAFRTKRLSGRVD